MERKRVGQQDFKIGRIYSDTPIDCDRQALLQFIEVNKSNHSCFYQISGPKKYEGQPIVFLPDVWFYEVESNEPAQVNTEDLQYSPAELVKQEIPERRMFAAMAMQGLLSNPNTYCSCREELLQMAIEFSESLITELDKEETK